MWQLWQKENFEIECDVDTSAIQPHPGGHLYVSFGVVRAMLSEMGGDFYLGDQSVAHVGAKFHMLLSLSCGNYSIAINGVKKGEVAKSDQADVKIVFGFKHEGHFCKILSHAYMRGIKMRHGISGKKQ